MNLFFKSVILKFQQVVSKIHSKAFIIDSR